MIRRVRGERGAAAVEFALVLLPLCLILLGIIEFGWIFNQQISLSNAAREAARYYVVHQSDPSPATPASAIAFGKAQAPSVSTATWSDPKTTFTLNGNCTSTGGTISTAVSIPMPWLAGLAFVPNATLKATGQMACIY